MIDWKPKPVVLLRALADVSFSRTATVASASPFVQGSRSLPVLLPPQTPVVLSRTASMLIVPITSPAGCPCRSKAHLTMPIRAHGVRVLNVGRRTYFAAQLQGAASTVAALGRSHARPSNLSCRQARSSQRSGTDPATMPQMSSPPMSDRSRRQGDVARAHDRTRRKGHDVVSGRSPPKQLVALLMVTAFAGGNTEEIGRLHRCMRAHVKTKLPKAES